MSTKPTTASKTKLRHDDREDGGDPSTCVSATQAKPVVWSSTGTIVILKSGDDRVGDEGGGRTGTDSDFSDGV